MLKKAQSPRRLLIFAVVLYWQALLPVQAQVCACTNCPVPMPDGFTGTFSIQVQGADNPVVGQQGQALCKVRLRFEHAYIGDLQITLTSPDGRSVVLVGPVGFFNATNFSEWNVSFVPCSQAAHPDQGFPDIWSNAQGWGALGNYNGSYYPNTGCLEDFNGSPVNGAWTLKVEDLQTGDTGTFLDYELVFCDPDGIECTNCAANAGFLLEPDVFTCTGDTALNLQLQPVYFDPQKRPPAATYDYTYVISGAGNVILDYTRTPDLRTYPPGRYTVCGCSYYKQHLPLLPSPNGVLTYTELATRLNTATPPFCGRLTNACVSVHIKDQPKDTLLQAWMCTPECVIFFGQTYCKTGTYTRKLRDEAACIYTATLVLTIDTPSMPVILRDTVCAGACSKLPGFEHACATGIFTDTLQNVVGCDSVRILELLVRDAVLPAPVWVSVDSSVCIGDTLRLVVAPTLAATAYRWTEQSGAALPVVTTLPVLTDPWSFPSGATICVSAVNACAESPPLCTHFTTLQLPPAPAITGPDTVCADAIVYFKVDSLSGASGVQWQIEGGEVLGRKDGFEIAVRWHETYQQAKVCASLLHRCGNSAPACRNIVVETAPDAPIFLGDTLLCTGGSVWTEYQISGPAAAYIYQWELSGAGQLGTSAFGVEVQTRWEAPGGRLCVVASGRCGLSTPFCLAVKADAPPVLTAGTDADTCGQTLLLNAAHNIGSGIWAVVGAPDGGVTTLEKDPADPSNSLTVDLPGRYQLAWIVTNGVCVGRDTVDLQFKSAPLITDVAYECDTVAEYYQVILKIEQGTPPFNINGEKVSGVLYSSVSFPSNTAHRFVLTDANACNAPVLEGIYQCACLSQAGTMPENLIRLCQNDSTILPVPADASPDPNDAACFILHTNADNTLGNIWAISRTGTLRFQSGMEFNKTYYISYAVGNQKDGVPDLADPCLSVSKGQAIQFLPEPQALAGDDAAICGLVDTLQAKGAGGWSLLSGPPGASLSFLNGANDPESSCRADAYGLYHLLWVVDNGACRRTDTLALQFQEIPQLSISTLECDSVSEQYKLRLSILGGTPPYLLNNIPWQDSKYESPWLDNHTSFQYQISDANRCEAPLLSGMHTCPCLSDAGHLDTTRLLVCSDETIHVDPPADAARDANDGAWFVLHTAADDPLGTAIDIRSTGLFTLQQGMSPGRPYYVSFVVGNVLNGAPAPGYSCLSVAKGPSIVFFEKPLALAGVDQHSCTSAIPLQAGASGGIGQWVFDSSALRLAQGTLATTNTALASAPGRYTLVWEVANSVCSARDTVELDFYPPVRASMPAIRCDSVAESFQVQFNIEGGTPPYKVNSKETNLNAYLSQPLPSGTAYRFLLLDANGCQDTTVSGVQTCACLSRAGAMAADTLKICEDAAVSAQLVVPAQPDPNDSSWFVLHTLPGNTPGDVLAYNQSGVFEFQSGWQYEKVYYIAHFVGNTLNGEPDWTHPCAQLSKGQPVLFYKKTQANAGPDADTCGLIQTLRTVSIAGKGRWSILEHPPGATLKFSPTQVSAGLPGQYRAVWTVSNNACQARDTVQWEFYPLPVLSVASVECDSINQHFQLVCVPSGGMPPYRLNGLLVDSTVFIAGPFNSSTGYTLQLSDDKGCVAAPLSGQHTCVCSSRAGALPTTLIQVCEGEPLQVGAPLGENLDPNDAGVYTLHTAAGNVLGAVWAQNADGRFTFKPGMSYDSIYYISRVVGNARNGVPDPNDVCLSVGRGQAVRFLPAPGAEVKVTPVRCYGEQNGAIEIKSLKGLEPILVAINDGALSARTVFRHLAPGLYRLRAEDANGCNWQSEPIDVAEPPRLTVRLPQQVSLSLGDTLLLEASVNPPNAVLDTLWWQPLSDSLSAGRLWQRIAPHHSAVFSLTAIDTAGCMAEGRALVTVRQNRQVYVPNTVALQSAANAGLTVYTGPGAQEVLEFSLYDRWGNQWYQRKNFGPGSLDPALADQLIAKKIVPIVLIYKTVILWKDGSQNIFWGDIFLIN